MSETVPPVYSGAFEHELFQKMVSREARVVVFFSGHVCLLDWGRRSLRHERNMHHTLAVPHHTGFVSDSDIVNRVQCEYAL